MQFKDVVKKMKKKKVGKARRFIDNRIDDAMVVVRHARSGSAMDMSNVMGNLQRFVTDKTNFDPKADNKTRGVKKMFSNLC